MWCFDFVKILREKDIEISCSIKFKYYTQNQHHLFLEMI